ncbi:MAG TPA: hypothetical protein VFY79_12400, partial [Dehalococcoidia bacterium]|nr:hypothetical protein [Dehalococcoidia bacterium]
MILCATDAGGAANLAPLVPVLRARGVPVEVITRPSLAHVFEGVRVMPPPPETPAAMARAIAARAIVCGTTCFESVDRHFVAAGRRLGIRTTVVLDERYDYSARFVVDAAPVWPDAVTVLDAASVDEAEA